VQARTQELEKKNAEVSEALDHLRNAQRQLVQNEKMASLGRMTAGIAHEIKNPLNFVNNFSSVSAEMIDDLEEMASREEHTEFMNTLKQNLQKISHHGRRADSIIQSMLMHTRTGELHKEPADLNKLVADVVHLAVTSFRANESAFICDIRTDFAKDLPPVPVIPQEISRVVLNLVDNALYATQARRREEGDRYRPTLEVRTRVNGDRAELVVRDNGAGIPAAELGNIFEPFFTTKPTGEGNGLGLSMSFDIVKAHGGNITAESVAGDHTEFVVSLPF
jgi:signal transduction histidine kinase